MLRDRSRAGFSLIEVLAALALTAAMVAVVIPLAIHLVARWSAGEEYIGSADAWMQAQLRLSDDLAQLVPISIAGTKEPTVAFRADATFVTLVRPGIGSRSALDLDTVTLSIESASSGDVLYRSAVPFSVNTFAGSRGNANRTAVLSGPFRLQFRAVGADGAGHAMWKDDKALPWQIVLLVREIDPSSVPATSFVFPIIARTPLAGLATPE